VIDEKLQIWTEFIIKYRNEQFATEKDDYFNSSNPYDLTPKAANEQHGLSIDKSA